MDNALETIPTTTVELIGLGYELVNPTRCKGCLAKLAWWRTPGGLFVPFEEYDGMVALHYFRCETMTKACHERLRQYEAELEATS